MNFMRLMRFAERQIPKSYRIIPARNITNYHIKYMETQDKWRERDGLSEEWQLIYKAPMENVLKYVTSYLTFSTTAVGASGLYYGLFVFSEADMNTPVTIGGDVVIANGATEFLVYLGAFVAFHIAVKILLSKYVLRLYQNDEDYLAVFRGHWYNSIKKHQFNVKEVTKLSPTWVVTWGDARFGLGKKHAILLELYFKTPEYFNQLLSAVPDDQK